MLLRYCSPVSGALLLRLPVPLPEAATVPVTGVGGAPWRQRGEAMRGCCGGAQVTYSTLMDGCVRGGRLRSAERLLRGMARRGVPPNAVTFNILLRGVCARSNSPLQVGDLPLLLSPVLCSARSRLWRVAHGAGRVAGPTVPHMQLSQPPCVRPVAIIWHCRCRCASWVQCTLGTAARRRA